MLRPGHKPGRRLIGDEVNRRQLRKILGVPVSIRNNNIFVVPGALSLSLRVKFNDMGLCCIHRIKSGRNKGQILWEVNGDTLSSWHDYLDAWTAEQARENCH